MKMKLATISVIAGVLLIPALTTRAYADENGNGSTSAKVYVKDSAITAKIKAKLAEQKPSSLVRISVETDDNGVVWLDGDAVSKQEADKAVLIARQTEGVTEVKNHINIKQGS